MVRGNKQAPATKSKPSPQTRPKKNAQGKAEEEKQPTIPLFLQQKTLDVFRNTLQPGQDTSAALQEVKTHLFNRDFAQAFGKEEYLRAYAGRWSPSRALAYHQVLTDVQAHILASAQYSEDVFRVVCIGGGAGGELVALAAWLKATAKRMHATLVDIAAWDAVVAELHEAVVTPPKLSAYASAAVREANEAMVDGEGFSVMFRQKDALEITDDEFRELFGDADFITMMFTLNELYSTSIVKTQAMLAKLTAASRPGTHLLVVDSPGSYSTVCINGKDKKYPMQWLVDLTLVGGKEGEEKWEKVVGEESRWFRLPQGLKYPIELENMRYQIHLYTRLG